MRSGASSLGEQGTIDTAFGISSVITPFALGAAVGGIASGRVPVGNAAGDLITSWLNPTSILIGVLAVVTGAYLAAVFLCGDAVRAGDDDLVRDFRSRALVSGVVAGAIAIGGLAVLHSDAHALFEGLVTGKGLPALIVSAVAGLATLALVWAWRFEPARYTAAVAVAAIVAGWALAQSPTFLPGLTVRQAAAPHDTLVAVVVAVLAGGALLFPSLGTLFRLTLRGHLDHAEPEQRPPPVRGREFGQPRHERLLVRVAGALFIAGFGFLNVAEAQWAHIIGAVCMLAFVATGFRVALPAL
jgi:cytochrome d ubiquinol oxidase subunit II